ncbi:MAG TPA: ABC transporter permease [Acidobacteriaceae bacterium]|jgi:putative ABC transport system permease protein
MHGLLLNLRLAMRQLRRTPGFALTVVLTLALGIGATTTIFSLVEGVLLRPLPFHDPASLISISDSLSAETAIDDAGVTAAEIRTYLQDTTSFSSLGGYTGSSYELSGRGEPVMVNATRMTAGVFPTLAVAPSMGRVFTQQEDAGHATVAVLSYHVWQSRFHGDPNILGNKILLDRKPYVVIGVMPRNFEFPLVAGRLNQSELWVPMSFTPDELSPRGAANWGYNMVGRLKPGFSLEQANQDADRVAREVMRNFPPELKQIHITAHVNSLKESTVKAGKPLVHILMYAVLVVLLIACLNVAGLLLVRAIRRRRELAVRLALGASPRALLGNSLMEGILLSGTGGVLGLLLAAIALQVTVPLLPESMPRIDGIHLDAGVVFFALILALLTGALCGLAPAFAAIRTRVNENLKEGGRTGSAGGSHGRLRSALVVTEIAVALVLLTTAGALVRSFQKMRDVDPGFRADHVLVAGYNLPSQQYPNPTASDAFNRSLLERLQAMPGVVAAGITNVLPASGFQGGSAYVLDETAHEVSDGQLKIAPWSASEGKYFQAMGIRLVQGRLFNADDKQGAPLVALVNQKLANRFWPKGDAIGRRLRIGTPESKTPWVTIVGVVENTKMNALDAPDTEQIYAPSQQLSGMFGQFAPKDQGGFNGFIALRSTLPPEQMTNALRSTVAALDPQLALQQMQTMDEALSSSEAPRRFNTSLVSVFALGALLLAAIGIYAVIAFSVSMRSQEMAIRMALGSRRVEIVRLVLIAGAKLAAIGCVAGLVGALAVSKLLGSMLFNVSATDPLILTGSIATMIVLSLVACAIPAQRAASANPVDALRSE